MNSFSSMKNKLSAIGIYNIENGSNIYNELKAYSVELDRIFSELDTMLREYFIETAQSYGITLREKFLGREKTEYSLEKRREMLKIQQESIKAVKKAISRIKNVNNSDKDLFIQVLDKSLFNENDTNDDIYKKIFNSLYEQHNIFVSSLECDIENNHVIVIGYSSTREEFEQHLK